MYILASDLKRIQQLAGPIVRTAINDMSAVRLFPKKGVISVSDGSICITKKCQFFMEDGEEEVENLNVRADKMVQLASFLDLSAEDKVRIKLEGTSIFVSYQTIKMELPADHFEDYFVLTEMPMNTEKHKIDGPLLRKLAAVADSADVSQIIVIDKVMQYKNSTYTVTALDKVPEGTPSTTIPLRLMDVIGSLGEIEVSVLENVVAVESGDTIVFYMVQDIDEPIMYTWEDLDTGIITAKRADIEEACSVARILGSSDDTLELKFTPDKCSIHRGDGTVNVDFNFDVSSQYKGSANVNPVQLAKIASVLGPDVVMRVHEDDGYMHIFDTKVECVMALYS